VYLHMVIVYIIFMAEVKRDLWKIAMVAFYICLVPLLFFESFRNQNLLQIEEYKILSMIVYLFIAFPLLSIAIICWGTRSYVFCLHLRILFWIWSESYHLFLGFSYEYVMISFMTMCLICSFIKSLTGEAFKFDP
jgi:hypothetical protein